MDGRDEWMEVIEFKLPAMSRDSRVGCTGLSRRPDSARLYCLLQVTSLHRDGGIHLHADRANNTV